MAMVLSLVVLSQPPAWRQRLLGDAFRQPPWHDCHRQRLCLLDGLPTDLARLARLIDSLVDQLALGLLVASYAGKGDLPHRPDLMLKAVLFLSQRGIHSPAAWHFQAHDSRAVAWLLRGVRPCRACWYTFRRRLVPLIDDLNRQLLQLAHDHGLLPGVVPVLDGTLLAANSTRHRLLNQPTLLRRQQQLQNAVAADQAAQPAPELGPPGPLPGPEVPARPTAEPLAPLSELEAAATAALPHTPALTQDPAAELVASTAASAEAVPAEAAPAETLPQPARAAGSAQAERPWPAWLAQTAGGRERQQEHYRRVQEQLQLRLEQNAKRRKEDRRPAEKVYVSPGDPEAWLGLDKEKVYRPVYNAQLACDLDTDFILAYGAYSGVPDSAALPPMLERLRDLLPWAVIDWVLSDAGYASGANLRWLEGEGVGLIAPYQENDWTKDRKAQKQIPKSAFKWAEASQVYVCPEGQTLGYVRTETKRRGQREEKHRVYRCPGEHCQACPRRQQCTSSAAGRTVMRNEYEQEVQRLKERMGTAEAKALYNKRKEQVERRIGDGKQHRDLRRLSMRGQDGAQLQLGLIALANNLVVFDKLSRAAHDVNPSPNTTSK